MVSQGAIIAVLVCVAVSLPAIAIHGWLGIGKKFATTISTEALANSPSWQDTADEPPIPARKAIELANSVKESLVTDSNDYTWQLRFAALTPSGMEPFGNDKWYWMIHYHAVYQHGFACGKHGDLSVAVLMDGTVIEPQISDAPY